MKTFDIGDLVICVRNETVKGQLRNNYIYRVARTNTNEEGLPYVGVEGVNLDIGTPKLFNHIRFINLKWILTDKEYEALERWYNKT